MDTYLPPNIVKCMRPEDRKALGVLTVDESRERAANKAERVLQNECEAWLRLNHIEFLHLSHRAREKEGWPDLIFANPYDEGRFYAAELKSSTGECSPEQVKCLAQLRLNGAAVEVIRSTTRFIQFVKGDE